MTTSPRYLHYPIDKHQSSPDFRNDFPDWLRENCDGCCDVVVDLTTGQRYWGGEWRPIDGWPGTASSDVAAPAVTPHQETRLEIDPVPAPSEQSSASLQAPEPSHIAAIITRLMRFVGHDADICISHERCNCGAKKVLTEARECVEQLLEWPEDLRVREFPSIEKSQGAMNGTRS